MIGIHEKEGHVVRKQDYSSNVVPIDVHERDFASPSGDLPLLLHGYESIHSTLHMRERAEGQVMPDIGFRRVLSMCSRCQYSAEGWGGYVPSNAC
jgi:hypothetical protein